MGWVDSRVIVMVVSSSQVPVRWAVHVFFLPSASSTFFTRCNTLVADGTKNRIFYNQLRRAVNIVLAIDLRLK